MNTIINTPDGVSSFLQAHVKSGELSEPIHLTSKTYQVRVPCDPITCVDGYKISVQASWSHYCLPRNNDGPYDTFELGYPSHPDPIINGYAEDESDYLLTVYPNVPLARVVNLLLAHDGIVITSSERSE